MGSEGVEAGAGGDLVGEVLQGGRRDPAGAVGNDTGQVALILRLQCPTGCELVATGAGPAVFHSALYQLTNNRRKRHKKIIFQRFQNRNIQMMRTDQMCKLYVFQSVELNTLHDSLPQTI